MIIDKVFQTWNEETETGLTAYVNSNNEIYISCGKRDEFCDEQGKTQFAGFTILDLSDAQALLIELKCLIKEIEVNIELF